MKHLLVLGSLWLLANLPLAWATPPVLADTIPGQTLLTRSLATEACRQLAAKPGYATAATMSAQQAQEAFEQALSATIEKRVASIRQAAQRAGTAGAYEKLRAELPTAVALQLVKSCPTAARLYGRFGDSAAAEDSFIAAWGDELCQRLTTLQTKGLLQNKTSAARIELFHQEFTASLIQRGPQIMQLYGAAGNSQPVMEQLSSRVTDYMQQHCLPALMLLKDGN